MKRAQLCTVYVGLFIACFAGLVAATPACAVDRKEVVKQARQSYCNLRDLGLAEFQATIKPNWEVVLGDQVKTDPKSAEAALKLLNGLHFSMKLDSADKVTVDHSADAPPPNEKAAAGFEQIYSGMSQAMDGFFETWSAFMLHSPFPAVEDEYKLEEVGAEYRLSWKEKDTNVVANLSRNLIMTELLVTSKDFTSTLKPQFAATPGGLVLSGYEADYVPASGPGKVHLKVKLDYQDVSGLQLLRTLFMDSTYDGTPNQIELAFSNYQLKKR